MGNILDSGYNAAAGVGQAMSMFNAIGGTMVGLIFLIVGIFLIIQARKYFTQGSVVTSVTCPQSTNGKVPTGNCKVTCDSPTCKNINVSAPQGKYNVGDNIELQCDKDQPCDCTAETPQTLSMTWAGWLIILISIFVIFMVWSQYYLTRNYKGFAAVVGVSDLIGMAKQI